MSKSISVAHAVKRVNKTLLETSKTLGERTFLVLFYWIVIKNTVLLILEWDMAMSKKHQLFVTVLITIN